MADAKSKVKRACKEISFTVPWGVIAAKAWGPDDGKPFLGLHGYLDNANTFDRYTRVCSIFGPRVDGQQLPFVDHLRQRGTLV